MGEARPGNVGFGPNLSYYRHCHVAGFSTFGTIDTAGAVTDRFGVDRHSRPLDKHFGRARFPTLADPRVTDLGVAAAAVASTAGDPDRSVTPRRDATPR
jgi:hypothetical protein